MAVNEKLNELLDSIPKEKLKEEFAREVIWRWREGKRFPDTTSVQRLCWLLNMTMDKFYATVGTRKVSNGE